MGAGNSVVNKVDVISGLREFIAFTDCFTDEETKAQIGDWQRWLSQ